MTQTLLFICLLGALAAPVLADRPNVLLIISDDQGYCELGSFLKFADPETLQPMRKGALAAIVWHF